jgi:ribosomal protein L3 glutamine methyltransferase
MNTDFSAALAHLVTVRDWLRYAVSRFNAAGLFFGHGTDNAWDEAVWLILHSLHLPPDRLEPFLDAHITPAEAQALAALLAARVDSRKPAAYLTGEAWLRGFRFAVDERVIVPRSFIAGPLLEQFHPWLVEPEAVISVLDLCTGSGCLAILAAQAFPQAEITAVDLSPGALDVARGNVADYGLQDRVLVVESDLFNALDGERYDLIVSNPPYVDAPSMAALPAEYRAEPDMALASGADGLAHTRRILAEAPRHLHPGGLLVVEIGHNRAAVEAAWPALPFVWLDIDGRDEFVFLLSADDLDAHGASAA